MRGLSYGTSGKEKDKFYHIPKGSILLKQLGLLWKSASFVKQTIIDPHRYFFWQYTENAKFYKLSSRTYSMSASHRFNLQS